MTGTYGRQELVLQRTLSQLQKRGRLFILKAAQCFGVTRSGLLGAFPSTLSSLGSLLVTDSLPETECYLGEFRCPQLSFSETRVMKLDNTCSLIARSPLLCGLSSVSGSISLRLLHLRIYCDG